MGKQMNEQAGDVCVGAAAEELPDEQGIPLAAGSFASTTAEAPPFRVEIPAFPDREFAIAAYGAVGDGHTLNTEPFERAIAACSEAGGGRVVVPRGVWLTGPIRLRSYVNLHLEQGALLLFSDKYEHYPLIRTTYEGLDTVRCQSPISGSNLTHVAITGPGIIDGAGQAWRPVKKFKMTAVQWKKLLGSGGAVEEDGQIWWPTATAKNGAKRLAELQKADQPDMDAYAELRSYLRPVLLSLQQCSRVLLDGPTFQNSPAWCLHPWLCEHVTVRNVTVRNAWFSQNGDGLDLDSCRYAQVLDSSFDVGDDAICLKSGKNEQGRRLNKPSEHIYIKGCTVYHGHGGVVIGSEMSGGVRDVTVADCTFIGTDIGLRFKSTRGRGGVVERVRIRGIDMIGIAGAAITFDLFYENSGKGEAGYAAVTEETPQFRNIDISRTTCVGAGQAVQMRGLPEMPVRGVTLTDVRLSAGRGIECRDAEEVRFERVTVEAKTGPAVELTNCVNMELGDVVCHSETPAIRIAGARTRAIRGTWTNGAPCGYKLELDSAVNKAEISGL